MEKDSGGETQVEVSMSYYEIYNDRVYDLFESPEKRTAVGLPLRESGGGKTVVVGLSEMPCGSLKEFEVLYDKANSNRSTSATKLNAHSSRSHAVLCVKLTITTPTEVRTSTASAIDLAGSEDNRRTGNDKERMVESASINKSLFVLAQCVEAISKKQQRIPYRESKMTRILSLGQNNGFTIMILNLAPVKSYHLDTLSSLNFANRTKKIEVREIENEPIFKGPPRPPPTSTGTSMQRQPLRPLTAGININLGVAKAEAKAGDKPLKAFSVYSDRARSRASQIAPLRSSPLKRGPEPLASSRPTKIAARPTPISFLRRAPAPEPTLSKATIEQLVEQKVSAILAAKLKQHDASQHPPRSPVRTAKSPLKQSTNVGGGGVGVSEEVQRRLASIEQRLSGQEGARAEGLSFLLMAKQHQARGEVTSALKMYNLARPYFPGNEKLERKIEALKLRIGEKRRVLENREVRHAVESYHNDDNENDVPSNDDGASDAEYNDEADDDDDGSNYHSDNNDDDGRHHHHSKHKKIKITTACPTNLKANPSQKPRRVRLSSPDPLTSSHHHHTQDNGNDDARSAPALLTPRTNHLLSIINTRDIEQIKRLKGVGPKRAEGIVECLVDLGGEDWQQGERGGDEGAVVISSLEQLSGLRGVGRRMVEGMRKGVLVG